MNLKEIKKTINHQYLIDNNFSLVDVRKGFFKKDLDQWEGDIIQMAVLYYKNEFTGEFKTYNRRGPLQSWFPHGETFTYRNFV